MASTSLTKIELAAAFEDADINHLAMLIGAVLFSRQSRLLLTFRVSRYA